METRQGHHEIKVQYQLASSTFMKSSLIYIVGDYNLPIYTDDKKPLHEDVILTPSDHMGLVTDVTIILS
jgi:hypothetical protein